jgi:thiamine biosynthesis protein ThiC
MGKRESTFQSFTEPTRKEEKESNNSSQDDELSEMRADLYWEKVTKISLEELEKDNLKSQLENFLRDYVNDLVEEEDD